MLLVVAAARHLLGRLRDPAQRPRDRAREEAGGDDAGHEGDAAGEEQARHQVAPGLCGRRSPSRRRRRWYCGTTSEAGAGQRRQRPAALRKSSRSSGPREYCARSDCDCTSSSELARTPCCSATLAMRGAGQGLAGVARRRWRRGRRAGCGRRTPRSRICWICCGVASCASRMAESQGDGSARRPTRSRALRSCCSRRRYTVVSAGQEDRDEDQEAEREDEPGSKASR